MNKPHPHTWTAKHFSALRGAALKLGGAPEKMPTDEEGHAFAAKLPAAFPHVEVATYNRDEKRVEVRLHGGGIAFHVPVVEGEEEPKVESGEERAA